MSVSSTASSPFAPSVTLTRSCPSRFLVCASGSFTSTFDTAIMGAVIIRMITSTSATSMMGVTFTFAMVDCVSVWKRFIRPSLLVEDSDIGGAALLGLVEHVDEGAVADAFGAAHEHTVVDAGGHQRLQRTLERGAFHQGLVDAHVLVRFDDDFDALAGLFLFRHLAALGRAAHIDARLEGQRRGEDKHHHEHQ